MKPRTIDIDIVFYDDLEVNKPNLKIPHYDWQNRSFFLLSHYLKLIAHKLKIKLKLLR